MKKNKENRHENIHEEIKGGNQEEIQTEVKEEVNSNNALEDKIKKLEEALLRNQAELMNYKRRKDEEVSRMLKYSEEDIIREFLPILDNFERALSIKQEGTEKFLEGFKMVYENLRNILIEKGVKEIDALHQEFDPVRMNAVLTETNPDFDNNIVLDVLQKGYVYQDKILRPAMVKVNEKNE